MSRKNRPFNNPFADQAKDLKKALKTARKAEKKKAAPPKAPAPEPVTATDEELFLRAMNNTERIEDPRGVVKPKLPPGHARNVRSSNEEAEVMAELADLVAGSGHFDISDSDEFIEGCVEGLDRRILRRLRRGDFSWQAHLDLHGLNREEARQEVDQFIEQRRRTGMRCLLIVHGRGLNSKDQIPVLKSHLTVWLQRGRISKNVLAFCTARPHDGGAGAMYVLLRK